MRRLGEHCATALAHRSAQDARIWVIDGDLADANGACTFADRWPERFIAAGIAEPSMVSMAAGMASCGVRPWVFSFASFLSYRAYDQIRVSISQTGQPVTLVGSHAGGCAGSSGKSHVSINDVALIASLPRVSVWAPAGPADVGYAVDRILDAGQPAYVRLPRVPLEDLPGAPATWRWLSDPAPTILLGTGRGSHFALAAARILAEIPTATAVIHCQRIVPLPDSLLQALARARRVFVVEDHSTFGGLASLLERVGLDIEVHALGWPPDWPGESGEDEILLAKHGLDAVGLSSKIAEAM